MLNINEFWFWFVVLFWLVLYLVPADKFAWPLPVAYT